MSIEINVTINVPDKDTCEGCDLWYRDQSTKNCYCLLFDMTRLDQRYKENMVSGTEILKCKQCKDRIKMCEKKE